VIAAGALFLQGIGGFCCAAVGDEDAQGLVPVSNIAPNLSNVVGMFVLPNVSPSA